MTILDWLASLATLALGAGIYMYGFRCGAASKVPLDSYLRSGGTKIGDTIRVKDADAWMRAVLAEREAPTTKREIPGEEPAISRKENAS